MEQLILHLLGDYVLQSDWMASNKTSAHIPALTHATVYSLPFLLLSPSFAAFAVILGTHFLIDRFRLARFLVFAKEHLAPPTKQPPAWIDCAKTGYPSTKPDWLAVWLLIAADNTLHLAINYAALRWL